MIDNMAVVYGWPKGLVKNDKTASEVLKAAHYLASFLGVTIHVEHVPRMSNPLAEIADELSRKENSYKGRTNRILSNGIFLEVESCLTDWLKSPCESSLCERVMKEAGEKHPNLCFAE